MMLEEVLTCLRGIAFRLGKKDVPERVLRVEPASGEGGRRYVIVIHAGALFTFVV